MLKNEWIDIFRNQAKGKSIIIANKYSEPNKCAELINKYIKNLCSETINSIKTGFENNSNDRQMLLEEILLVTYVSYIVMLEFRNKFRKYEYMDFARRVGELWEPFCKLPFYYPLKELELVLPPKFIEVQSKIYNSTILFIESLNLDNETKKELIKHFDIPWSFVDSGCIKLDLDLHFKQNNIVYNCDFKSGFSSNEKGNTNRLLLVASIYNSVFTNQQTLMFVRQKEDENNHYLQTLKKSMLWRVYCCDETYSEICKFTGFDLRAWINQNIDWLNDIDNDLKEHLETNNLLKYLTW